MAEKVRLSLNIRNYGIISKEEKGDFYGGGICIATIGNIREYRIDVKCHHAVAAYAKVLCAAPSAFADIELGSGIDGVLSREQYNPNWSRPSFEKDLSKIPGNIQNMLIKQGGKYTAVLPLCTDDFISTIEPSDESNTLRVNISKLYEGSAELDGVFLIIAVSDNPYAAVREAYEYAAEKGYIKVQLCRGKKLSDTYRGIGWCTWNAFYHDVTEEGIVNKMEELKSKGISLKWIIIDDGWSTRSERDRHMLTSFHEDRVKFPNGLSACIKRLKHDYGVEKVGIWHSFNGYWFGIEAGGELYNMQKHNLEKTNIGYYIPSSDGAYDFFSTWHSYLKKQGVDFLKIDTQGDALELLRGESGCTGHIRKIQEAIDKSAYEHFGDSVINCMGMHNLNVQSRPYTCLMRSSDDFQPDKKGSFKSHIEQNAYNSVFLKDLYFCDYDMFWTKHESARVSGILRSISGGPFYISDEVGNTDASDLSPFADNDGNIRLCDGAALPSEECLFGYDGVLTLTNTIDGKEIRASFNLTDKNAEINIGEEKLIIPPHDVVVY